jgi:bifunctional non-homologous end joining protein LigD
MKTKRGNKIDDQLERYRTKRNFVRTPEPTGRSGDARPGGPLYVVQKHAATRLHYDFRLEMDGTLKSWAVPKGPSLDPAQKRLAVHVEDHPLEYADFEGIIPPTQYGAGTVLIWDRGTWRPQGDPEESYRRGVLKFQLDGQKLHGAWTLVRMQRKREGKENGKENWLLIKERDTEAKEGTAAEIVETQTESVQSGRG